MLICVTFSSPTPCYLKCNFTDMSVFSNQLTREQARRWSYFRTSEWNDFFYPIQEWPHELQRLGVASHLTNRQRWFFFNFLVENGLHPYRATEAILSAGGYDDSAIRHLKFLETNWTKYHTRHWDMSTRTYVDN